MIVFLIGVAVIASLCALVLLYWRVLDLTFPEKLSTDEVYMVTTGDLWKIRVCRYRRGRTNGQPVLLVHGANVNQHTFTSPRGANLVEHLVERGFDCWTVDLRGCHSSEAPFERHRNQVTADDYLNEDIPTVIRFIQQETGYAKVHYCGQSLGGMLLYAYVLKYGAEAIASGVTLGAPLGFDGVHIRRSPGIVALVSLFPPLTGSIARGLIPLALLLRVNPRVFPMNMRNIARGLNTGSFYNMLEDPLPGVLRQLVMWVNTPGWRMDGGQWDVQEHLKDLNIPLFAIFAPLDPFIPLDRARAFFEALRTDDKRLLIASKELGFKRDYNHCDLAFGLEGPREIFGPIARWFETHSSRAQMALVEPMALSGYQAPLRPSERAGILSGGSYAHLATAGEAARAEAVTPVKVPGEEAIERKSAPRKTSARKPAVKKPAVKKAPTKKTTAKKAAVPKTAAAKPAPTVKKSPAAKTSQAPDLASVSAALTALRPATPRASAATAPIQVKQAENAPVPPGRDEPVETPRSVLKALSNASSVMEAFKKPESNKEA